MKLLEGEKIILRAPEKTDLPVLRDFYNDYEMRGVYMGGYRPMPTEQYEKERIMKKNPKKKVLMIEDKESRELIGTVGYIKDDFNSAQIGIVIGKPGYRRGGYGTEAVRMIMKICFLEENFQKLFLWTGGWNIPAQRHAEYLGFKLAFKLRKGQQRNGKWYDSCCYDMLREEYLEKYGNDQG